ncbi:MAG: hypothetical protein AAF529_19585 [Pseudomonadota bacterium]
MLNPDSPRKHSPTRKTGPAPRVLGLAGIGLWSLGLVGLAINAQALDLNGETSAVEEVEVAAMANLPINYAALTDTELTELTARWGELDPEQRRALLAVVRSRMAQKRMSRSVREPRGAGRVQIQRRYGRNPDGTVTVETRVVRKQMQPVIVDTPVAADPEAQGQVVSDGQRQRIDGQQRPATKVRGRVTFGIGFERRTRVRAPQQGDAEIPPAPNNPESE